MKNFAKKTGLILAVLSFFFITGCGDSDSDFAVTTSGNKAIDGYLSGATAFIDTDINGEHETDDPSVRTEGTGQFSFSEVSDSAQKTYSDGKCPVIVYGGFDTGTWVNGTYGPFTGKLKAPAPANGRYENLVVTPMTTLVQAIVETGADLNDAKETVAKTLGLDLSADEDILKIDPIADQAADSGKSSSQKENAKKIHKLNVKIANTLKIVAKVVKNANANDSQEDLFDTAAKKLAEVIKTKAQSGKKAFVESGDDADAKSGAIAKDVLDKVATDPSVNVHITVAEKNNVGTLAGSQAAEIEKTDDLNTIGAVASIVQEKIESETPTYTIDPTDLNDKVDEVKDNADTSGDKAATETKKAFALSGNKINGVAVDKSGKLASTGLTITSDSSLSFTLLNYTGAAYTNKTIAVIIEAASTTTDEDIRMEFPLTLTATAAQAGKVSIKLPAEAEMKLSGTTSTGNSIETKIKNEASDSSDIISTGSDGAISLKLQGYVDRFEAKGATKNIEFDIAGEYNFKLTVGGVLLGYQNTAKTGLDSTFASVTGKIYFQ